MSNLTLDVRHAVRGLLRNLPSGMLESPPRIAAATPVERAALGYLHGNCGHCHNDNGSPPPVDLVLAQSVSGKGDVMRSLLGASSRYRAAGMRAAAAVIEPGRPEASLLALRMRSRSPLTQMPPLGSVIPDHDAIDLLSAWIAALPRQ